ncbi:alpha/beta fold hydrolase [Nocardia sp. NBC_00511]|uniref:alpha/beta fold hydrolase n=1 Tax=Nocardia sp. NBC_00511 TaxID=2903591 RepID=UPI0030DF7AD6
MTAWHRIERGAGQPLVLLHGAGASARCWLPVLDRLATHRRVIALDLPGFGDTPPPGGMEIDAEWLVTELAAELRRLGLDGPVDLVGNSLGGFIALEAARRGLARSVVALAPAALWHNGMPKPLRRIFLTGLAASALTRTPARHALAVTAIRRTLLDVVVGHPERMTAADAIAMGRDLHRSGPTLRRLLRTAEHTRFTGGQSISVPVTVAFGDLDRMLPHSTSQVRDELPAQTRWLTLPDCGHVPMWDNPELIARTILEGTAEHATEATA